MCQSLSKKPMWQSIKDLPYHCCFHYTKVRIYQYCSLPAFYTIRPRATKDMGKMLGGDEEKDPDAQKKEEERQEALRQQEEERKQKHIRMEAEREKVRQQIRDK
eukprot:g44097.t1